MKKSSLFVGLLLASLSVIGFASTFVFGSELTRECGVSSAVLSFLRFVIASAVMSVPVLASRSGRTRLRTMSRRDWIDVAWLGPVGTSLMAWFVFLGCARVGAANASMADALTPILIFLMASLVNRKCDWRGLTAIAVGLAGVLLVIQVIVSDGFALEAYSTGDVYILVSASLWGVYTVCGRPVIERIGSSLFSLLTMATGAIAIGLVLPFTDVVWPTTAKALGLVAALGLFSTLLAFWTWNAAQKHLPQSVLAVSAYFTPVAAIAMAIVLLGDKATSLQWIGSALIVISGFLETMRTRQSRSR